MNDQITVGDRIKKVRTSKGISQKQLANILEVSQAAVSQFEKNEKEPKIETIKKIAKALDVPYAELLDPFPWKELTNNLDDDLKQQLKHYGITHIYNAIRDSGYNVATNLYDPSDLQFKVTYSDGITRRFTMDELKQLQNENTSYLKFKLEEFKDK